MALSPLELELQLLDTWHVCWELTLILYKSPEHSQP